LQQFAQAELQTLGTQINTPPSANAGTNQTVECSSANGTVTLSGAASDPDCDPLNLVWKNSTGTIVGNTATITQILPLGTSTYSFSATDTASLSATSSTSVTVRDSTPCGLFGCSATPAHGVPHQAIIDVNICSHSMFSYV
jgi:hypothetical protein